MLTIVAADKRSKDANAAHSLLFGSLATELGRYVATTFY